MVAWHRVFAVLFIFCSAAFAAISPGMSAWSWSRPASFCSGAILKRARGRSDP